MISLIAAFFASFFITLLIIRYKHLHEHFSGDHDLSGPQKFHMESVPRIGGISIAAGILSATIVHLEAKPAAAFEILFLLCAIPTFAIGLTEDLTKIISVRTRLLLTALAAGLAAFYLGAQIPRLDIPGIDYLLSIPLIPVVFTVFAITGLSNAYNIIDGFNGLSSMVGIISLLGLAYISFLFGDSLITHLSLAMVSSILGFFIWNYPRGLIFLGDGGAYLIGFWIALLSILLVARHPEISPWFALLINAYPVLETLFTIYRRKIHQGKSPGQPDGIHFHTLIYRRILNPTSAKNKNDWLSANSKTAPYLWILSGIATVPAILWWKSTPILISVAIAFTIFYVWIYKRIVTFRTPRWLISN
jgi:UDP-N-acetylmuramyl pentapeptide phosphotransferase/UDP-N-acetylglucosamine-1-phosphate transferase